MEIFPVVNRKGEEIGSLSLTEEALPSLMEVLDIWGSKLVLCYSYNWTTLEFEKFGIVVSPPP